MTALTVDQTTMPVLGRLAPYASREEQIAHVAEAARQIRIQDLKLVHYAGAGHIGGDFSAIDILATLYGAVLNVTPETVDDPDRDRFILSKGHVAGALYTTLASLRFPAGGGAGHLLEAPVAAERPSEPQQGPGVEANTGPLGHGLPIAVGHAISAKLDVSRRRTYVLTGDGELQEGSNWEAMMAASQYELDSLTVIVDRNRLQQGATTRETNDLDPLDAKAAAFGFAVVEVNGHDHGELLDVLVGGTLQARQADLRDRPHPQGPPDLVHGQQRRLAPQGAQRRPVRPGAGRARIRRPDDQQLRKRS